MFSFEDVTDTLTISAHPTDNIAKICFRISNTRALIDLKQKWFHQIDDDNIHDAFTKGFFIFFLYIYFFDNLFILQTLKQIIYLFFISITNCRIIILKISPCKNVGNVVVIKFGEISFAVSTIGVVQNTHFYYIFR